MPFTNPPGGPKRNFNLFAWSAFIFRLLTKPQPIPPSDFVIPTETVLKQLTELKKVDTLTWLGHNAVLFKLNNKFILVDPYLTDYASPIPIFGPKRYTPPGIPVNQLPPIDLIMITHDHYDHLDLRALTKIPNKESITVVLPLKNGSFFHKLGYKKIYELDWHQSISIDDIVIRALPSYHFCKRGLFERNKRLWANFAITTPNKKIFFDGNTAYGSIFLDQGRDYGPFDYALMSVGAYEPHQLMQESHVTPELAVKIAEELKANVIIPIHWGTVVLSDEPPFEPPVRFQEAALNAGYAKEAVWIMKIGETRILK